MTSTRTRAAWWRRFAGVALAALVLPFLLGDKGCYTLETPIGDPDHGWADPRISGIWIAANDAGDVPRPYATNVWIFDPFDAKTWLVTLFDFKDSGATPPGADANQISGAQLPEASTAMSATESSTVDVPGIVASLTRDRASPGTMMIYKAWTVSLGGRRFLVLEQRVGMTEEPSLAPQGWHVFAADMKDGLLLLSPVDNEVDSLHAAKTRAQAEAIIARHARDPKLTHPANVLHPVPKSSYRDAFKAMHRALSH